MKLFLALAISVGLFFGLAKANDDGPKRAYIPVVYPQIVQIQFSGSHCSGAVVDEDVVLTAAHCIPEDDSKMFVQFTDGRLEEATPLAVGKTNGPEDSAFISVETEDIEPFEISDDLPHPSRS